MMKALSAQNCQTHVNAYNGGLTLSTQINASSFTRGQKVLAKKSNNYFSQEDEEGQNTGKLSKNALLSSFLTDVSKIVNVAGEGP